jgi:hypothetical protein
MNDYTVVMSVTMSPTAFHLQPLSFISDICTEIPQLLAHGPEGDVEVDQASG